MNSNERLDSLFNSTFHQDQQQQQQQPRQEGYDKQFLLKWNHIIPGPGSSIPPPRSGAASVVVKGRLYMFGVSARSTISEASLMKRLFLSLFSMK